MIGERLAEVRKDNGDKQADLARKLSVSLAAVRSWEQDKSSPSHDVLVHICQLYQISSDYLLGISNIDPVYVQRQYESQLSEEDMRALKDFREYLLWKRRRK